MLILIAGITGNIGRYAAEHALAQGHQVRGLGRSPSKLSANTFSLLESFVASSSYFDIAALDKACTGVDAVICAYAGLPELHLDGQLLLLRAAERAKVTRFLAAGWNYDWRKIDFGDEPIYDAIMAFHRQAELSSPIRPLHIFSGMLAEVFFGTEGQAGFTPKDRGVWDPDRKTMDIWGDGKEAWYFTTEEDAGKYGVEVIVADGAENGGFVTVCSWKSSLMELKAIYENVRGQQVKVEHKGSLEELERKAIDERQQFGNRNMWDWHRLWFLLYSSKGTWSLSDLENNKYPNVKATSAQRFLEAHPEV